MAASSPEKELEITQQWEPNPLVVISKRNRSLLFPKVLLQRDITQDDLTAWKKAEDDLSRGMVNLDVRQEQPLYLHAGVNFLGVYSTVFAFKKLEQSQMPVDGKGRQLPPPVDKLVLLYPSTPAWRTFEGPAFVDPLTRQIQARKVHEAFRRIFAYMKKRDDELSGVEGRAGLFAPPPGFEAAEILVMPLSDVFTQKGAEGQAAYQYVLAGIKHHKDLGHLGALHDYAFRSRSGWAVVEACRNRSVAFKLDE